MGSLNTGAPLADPVAEGRRIAEEAARGRSPVRLTGGVAIALRCPSADRPELQRVYADIDVVVRRRDSGSLGAFLGELGYEPDREFNALHGARRQLFWTADRSRQIDVFLDRYEMCHRLDLRDRLDLHPETLSLADLLLTKLQVVETTEKDLVDIATLLSDHALTEDESGINIDTSRASQARTGGGGGRSRWSPSAPGSSARSATCASESTMFRPRCRTSYPP